MTVKWRRLTEVQPEVSPKVQILLKPSDGRSLRRPRHFDDPEAARAAGAKAGRKGFAVMPQARCQAIARKGGINSGKARAVRKLRLAELKERSSHDAE